MSTSPAYNQNDTKYKILKDVLKIKVGESIEDAVQKAAEKKLAELANTPKTITIVTNELDYMTLQRLVERVEGADIEQVKSDLFRRGLYETIVEGMEMSLKQEQDEG